MDILNWRNNVNNSKRIKILHKEISRCDDCPLVLYLEDDSWHGYICTHELVARQIMKETDWFKSHKITIPDWCSLPDKENV